MGSIYLIEISGIFLKNRIGIPGSVNLGQGHVRDLLPKMQLLLPTFLSWSGPLDAIDADTVWHPHEYFRI